jgi:dihydrolipoamide dehydrogenase
MKQFELAIIGGGPGGYVAAIRAAKLGLSVALIEGRDLGGTCLNRGCIPSKTLLKHAEAIEQIKHASKLGVQVNDFSFSISEIIKRKNKVIQQLNSGIKGLLRQNKITVYNGFGHVKDNKTIKIKLADEEVTVQAQNVILATGSKPLVPPIQGIEEVDYFTSDTIFDIAEIPKHMVIIGGGVIGLEIACIFNGFGTKVEIVEMADRIIAQEDPEASTFLQNRLKQSGIVFHTNARVTEFKENGSEKLVAIEKQGNQLELTTNAILMCVGRIPNVQGLEELSISYDGSFVQVDKNLETNVPSIYAIGDIIGGFQLAHAASNEGLRVVNHLLGKEDTQKSLIPRCVYTFPEIASIGLTEAAAIEAGYQVKVKKVDLAGNGKAIAANENSGFMKLIADEKYGEILGVIMVGAHVTEMISQVTVFMHLEGTVDEIESMVFPHPTVSESLFESASAWLGLGIHYT